MSISLGKSSVIYLENDPSPKAVKEADLVRQRAQRMLVTNGN
jgi:hypothetical protein